MCCRAPRFFAPYETTLDWICVKDGEKRYKSSGTDFDGKIDASTGSDR